MSCNSIDILSSKASTWRSRVSAAVERIWLTQPSQITYSWLIATHHLKADPTESKTNRGSPFGAKFVRPCLSLRALSKPECMCLNFFALMPYHLPSFRRNHEHNMLRTQVGKHSVITRS